MTERTTTIKVTGHRGRLHRKLRGLIRMLEETGRWDTITVERAQADWTTTPMFHVWARRDTGTLASTYIYVYFTATPRGRIGSAHRYAALGTDRKLSGWRELRIWATI